MFAAQRNTRKDQTCYVVNESLIQETDMSVKLVANVLQESSSLQVTNVLQKRVKWNKNSSKKKRNRFQNNEDKYTKAIQSKAVVEREIDSGLKLTKEDTKNNLKIQKTRPQLTIEFE